MLERARARKADCAPGPGVFVLLPPVALNLMCSAVIPSDLHFSATSCEIQNYFMVKISIHICIEIILLCIFKSTYIISTYKMYNIILDVYECFLFSFREKHMVYKHMFSINKKNLFFHKHERYLNKICYLDSCLNVDNII